MLREFPGIRLAKLLQVLQLPAQGHRESSPVHRRMAHEMVSSPFLQESAGKRNSRSLLPAQAFLHGNVRRSKASKVAENDFGRRQKLGF
jgi:hypothetical protein